MRDAETVSQAAVKAVRTEGCRAITSGSWAGLALIDDEDDYLAGEPQAVVPQIADQP
ncbi:hypothetical protein ACFV98_35980 [Streptomyces violascens]|uniref:hypothetical protein n=1 Tax=Streptomyces violascens TaxID=67381 RepID=UPI00364EF51C